MKPHALLEKVIGDALKWTDDEREAFFAALAETFCMHCGRKKDRGEFCHCTNDE